jgi:hypothetical protein
MCICSTAHGKKHTTSWRRHCLWPSAFPGAGRRPKRPPPVVQIQEDHDSRRHLYLLVPGQLGPAGCRSIHYAVVRALQSLPGRRLDLDLLSKPSIRSWVLDPRTTVPQVRSETSHARVYAGRMLPNPPQTIPLDILVNVDLPLPYIVYRWPRGFVAGDQLQRSHGCPYRPVPGWGHM